MLKPASSLAVTVIVAASVSFAGDASDRFNFATGLLIKKEYELAVQEFDTLLKEHPDFKDADTAWYRLGDALSKLGRNGEAVTAFRKVVENYRESGRAPESYYRLGQLTAGEDHVKAAEYYAAVVACRPKHALAESAAFWTGEELFRAKSWEKAAEAYRKAMTGYPGGKYAVHSLYSLGWCRYEMGQYDAAARTFRELVEKHPASELAPESKLKLAQCLFELKKYDDAQKLYDSLLKTGGRIEREASVGAAWCLYRRGRLKESAAAFGAAAAVLGDDGRAITCAFNAGNALMELGDYDGAAKWFDKIVTGSGKHELAPESVYWKSYCLVRLGRFKEADGLLRGLRSGSGLEKRRAEILYTSAEAQFGLKDYRAAASSYAAMTGKFPEHDLADESAYGRMLALEKTGDLESAERAGIEFFERYAASNTAPLARFALGEYMFRLGKYAAALDTFRLVLEDRGAPDMADDALYKTGWCLMHLDRPAEAARQFNRVVAEYPKSDLAAESAYMAGRSSEKAGDIAAAGKEYAACMRAHPGGEYALRSHLALALLDLAGGNHSAALAKLDGFLAKGVDGPLAGYARVYRGEALTGLGRMEEALASYRQVSKAGGEASIDAAYGAGWTYRKMGRHKEAAEAFANVASSKSPKSEDAAFWNCRSVEDSGNHAGAAERYAAFAEKYPASGHADEAAYRNALCVSGTGGSETAERLYVEFLDERPKSEFAEYAIYDLGWLNMERGNNVAAERRFNMLLERYPHGKLVPDVRFRLGEIAYGRKQYSDAATQYLRALESGQVPFADKILYKLGWAYARLGSDDKALDLFRRIAVEFPDSELAGEARYRVGGILQKLGRYAEAVERFETVNDGDFAERALFARAECRRLAGNHKEALAAYSDLLKGFPKTEFAVRARLGRGHACRALGAFKDAITAYQSVVDATDTIDAAEALMGIGYCHYAVDAYEEAVKAFLKVDILYGYDELKPEALDMLARSWEEAGKTDKAEKYRQELKDRFPDSQQATGRAE